MRNCLRALCPAALPLSLLTRFGCCASISSPDGTPHRHGHGHDRANIAAKSAYDEGGITIWGCALIQTLTKNWLLLALCGGLNAMVSIAYLIMQDRNSPLTFQAWKGMVVFLGTLTLAAGACSIVTGIWRSATGKCWLLVVNGLALGALGLIYNGIFGLGHYGVAGGARISFRSIALLIVLMALSAAVLEWETGRILRLQRLVADGWLFGLAGGISVGFGLAFLALGYRWIRIEPGSQTDLLWLGCYFGFSAICMLGLALRLHGRRFSQSA